PIDPALTSGDLRAAHCSASTRSGTFGRAQGTVVLDADGRAGSIDFTLDADSVDTRWSVRDDFLRSELRPAVRGRRDRPVVPSDRAPRLAIAWGERSEPRVDVHPRFAAL